MLKSLNFYELGKTVLTYVLGVKRQAITVLKFQRYPMYNHYFILTQRTTFLIKIKYCTMMVRLADHWGTPRGRYDEHNGKFSLGKKPRFNRPVGERDHF